ncbi:TIGR01777 family oxidoreductase [Cytophaga aurantiaca]|uniref:TIGR01777 family oxidoreductase n=1 Tax=Cytophaga aurantiaca TaxID=29530 RepID=UPI00037E2A8D|nr:TIGR01777 family oxidoreductase [Cytophaga aurantiaca]
MKVLITGGSGLVGSELTKLLINAGYEVVWLSRNSGVKKGITCYKWDYKNDYIDAKAFEDVTYVVHLAGAGVFEKRWSSEFKKEIADSRIKATELLVRKAAEFISIKAFICASAIGIYGNSYNTSPLGEDAILGNDFLADVTKKWEHTTSKFKDIGRTIQLRIGIVLAKEGGAYPTMMMPIKYFVGSPLASGKQIISWIHILDVCRIILKSIEDDTMTGAYNVVAPNPVSNKEFTLAAAKKINKPILMPNVPSIALEILLGKQKAASVIQGIPVSSSKIEASGFEFSFPTLGSALDDLAKK